MSQLSVMGTNGETMATIKPSLAMNSTVGHTIGGSH